MGPFRHQSLGSASLVFTGALVLALSFFSVSLWEFSRTEADDRARIVQLAEAFVGQYAEEHSDGMPLPAAFRRMGLETFLQARLGNTSHAPVTVRVPGRPGAELGLTEPLPHVAEEINRIAGNRDASIHEELRVEDWRVIGRSIFPTFARSEVCVSCHNRELGTNLYAVGDVMGAFVVESDLTAYVVRGLCYAGVAFGLLLFGYQLLANREHRRTRAIVELEGQVKLERQQREAEAHSNFVLSHDSLTGLARRSVFMDRLKELCAGDLETAFFIALIDLDEFKTVNDTMGHDAGDALLVAVGTRLKQIAVEGGGLAARLGGDEFAMIIPQSSTYPSMHALGSRLVAFIGCQVTHNGCAIQPSSSVGLCVCVPGNIHDISGLLKHTDAALYAAKNGGKNQFCQFNDNILQDLKRRSLITSALPQAIKRDELNVVFQPKVCLATGKAVEFETLARWNLNSKSVCPSEFVRIAEETGNILDLDLATLMNGARFAVAASSRTGAPVRISSNISALGFRTPNIAEKIAACLRQANLAPERVTIEVTESVLVENITSANESLSSLRAHGIRVALDDFGTSYSSLRYLQQLVFDEIKIDRSFLQDIAKDNEKHFLFVKIVEMAKGLKKDVVVEGIENQAQLDLAVSTGADLGQGYFFSEPLDETAALGYALRLAGNRTGSKTG
ncbi:MAG: EAL domain-containing protein [Pseudomonadota bacterium]